MLEMPHDMNVLDPARLKKANPGSHALGQSRKRLRDAEAIKPVYDLDLIQLHAETLIKGKHLTIGLMAAAALVGSFFVPILWMIIWLTGALISILPLSLLITRIAGRKSSRERELYDPKRTRTYLLLAHLIAGFGWLSLSMITCDACGAAGFPIAKGIILLVAMAATAMACSAFWPATVATFFMPVIAYSSFGIGFSDPIELLMAAVLLMALPFFATVSSILQESTQELGILKAEKDHLVSELEVAKSLSDEARRRAEEANLAKSRFLASMSHELRTPLNAILGFSEVLAKEVLGPMGNATYRTYAEDIHRSGDHLLKLINDILDLSRIEAGGRELNEEALHFPQIVEECSSLLSLKIKAKTIHLECELDPRLPNLFADKVALRQVLLNLLSNAIKFTPVNGWIKIECGFTGKGGQYVSISDNGPGIPDHELKLVLTAFGQGAIAIKTAEQGAGLGLPIVQAIMDMHGGQLQLHSKMRQGTKVTVIFPPERTLLAETTETPEPISA